MSRTNIVPYAYCPKCKEGLFVGSEHICSKAVKPRLYCDQCKDYYEGKPSVHMQEVHGMIETKQLSDWDQRPNTTRSKIKTMPPIDQQNRKRCPDCNVLLRKDHNCQAAKPSAPAGDIGSDIVFDDHKELPSHKVMIKLAGVEITIKPL